MAIIVVLSIGAIYLRKTRKSYLLSRKSATTPSTDSSLSLNVSEIATINSETGSAVEED